MRNKVLIIIFLSSFIFVSCVIANHNITIFPNNFHLFGRPVLAKSNSNVPNATPMNRLEELSFERKVIQNAFDAVLTDIKNLKTRNDSFLYTLNDSQLKIMSEMKKASDSNDDAGRILYRKQIEQQLNETQKKEFKAIRDKWRELVSMVESLEEADKSNRAEMQKYISIIESKMAANERASAASADLMNTAMQQYNTERQIQAIQGISRAIRGY